MFGKWRWVGGAVVVALCVAVLPAEAQRGQGLRGPGARGSGGPFMGQSVNVALENQEQLELTQDQVGQLQEMKAVLDGDVAGLVEEMNSLRESIRNGEIAPDDGQRELGVLRGELISASSPLVGRVQEILTVEQHNRLQPLVRQDRPGFGRGAVAPGQGRASFRSGRMGARGMGRSGAVRGSAGLRPGFNGRGRTLAVGFRRGGFRVPVGPLGRQAPFYRQGVGGQALGGLDGDVRLF